MKKYLEFLLCGLLMLPLSACVNTNEVPPDDEPTVDSQVNICKTGDIVLEDGTFLTTEELTSINSGNPPVAVIAMLQENGGALGVGVHISDGCLTWAADGDQDISPAFAFADAYVEEHGLNSDTLSGWQIPSIEELSAIYENREAVNASLHKIYELDHNAAVDGLGTNWYWASTPSDTEDGYAWFVHYFNGYAACCPVEFDNLHVMAVRTFGEVAP